MSDKINDADRAWASAQIQEYTELYPRYLTFANTLQAILEQVARSLATEGQIQTRPKAIASFAEKIWRKRDKCPDPVHDFTDLAGGRIITMTQEEVKAVSVFIEKTFDIDWENSIDIGQRLSPTEFGYRSVHYIVRIIPGSFPKAEIPVIIPDEVLGLKAEIQVRTLLEHIWADFSHQFVYKKDYSVPAKWQREFAALAAVLEESDGHLSRIRTGLSLYTSRFGPYRERGQIVNRIDILTEVLRNDQKDTALADEIGRLCITIGDWTRAIATLEPFVPTGDPAILRDLGTALTNENPPGSVEFRRGQRFLDDAVGRLSHDAEAIATLAGTWREMDEVKARQLYERAFDAEPTNPFALSNYLDYVVAKAGDVSPVWMLQPTMQASIQRCRELAAVNLDLPWPYYNIAKFQLLLGDPYSSLTEVARAVQLTHDAWIVHTQLRSLRMLDKARVPVQGISWIESFLVLALAVKFHDDLAIAEVTAKRTPGGPLSSPVVIVAGGTESAVEEQIEACRILLTGAFEAFSGTIISGGTHAGVSALVGDIGTGRGDAVATIGYLPAFIPSEIRRDERYTEFRTTESAGFSPLEPLLYWTDIIASGIPPSSVRLVGINGGKISAVEYRIALALGAEVGIIQSSGRAASQLLVDEAWSHHPRLIPLPPDPMTLRAFLCLTHPLDPEMRLRLGRQIHEEYLTVHARMAKEREPNLQHWDQLPPELQESNLQQADHISEKLRTIGFEITPTERDFSFTNDEIEVLAELEHGRWNAERLRDGWRFGEKSVEKKTSPYLVPWSQLSDRVQEWDRETVRRIPQYLARIGLGIRRQAKASSDSIKETKTEEGG